MTDNQTRNETVDTETNNAIVEMMNRLVAKAKKGNEQLAESIAESPNHALHAITWINDNVKDNVIASIASAILADIDEEGIDPQAALDHHVGRITRSLLNDSLNAGSTSHFSNAVETAERAAYAYFLRVYGD